MLPPPPCWTPQQAGSRRQLSGSSSPHSVFTLDLDNMNTDACREQPPHLHTTLSLTSPFPPPVIYIYIELEAAVESEGRQPRLITTGDNRTTAPPLCRIITKSDRERQRERGGWNPQTPRCWDHFHLGKYVCLLHL